MDQLIGMYGGFLVELICFFIPLLISVLVVFEEGKEISAEEYLNNQAQRKAAYTNMAQREDVEHDDLVSQQAEEAKKDKKKKQTIENLLSPKRQVIIIYAFLLLASVSLIIQMFIRENIYITYSHGLSACLFSLSILFCFAALFQIGRVLLVVYDVTIKKFKKKN